MPQVNTALDDSANRTDYDVGAIADLDAKVFGVGSTDPLVVTINHGLGRVPVVLLCSKKQGLGDYYFSNIGEESFDLTRSAPFDMEMLVF